MSHGQNLLDARATDWLERVAVGASAACLVHCIGLPLLLAALPALATIVAVPESFHVWVLAFAVPASGIALLLGYRSHRARLPLLVGCAGLALLALGALVLLGGTFETPVTVGGSLTLAMSHVMNWRRRHDRHGYD